MKRVRLWSPATIGNVGPGFDCLGLCVEGLGDVFEVTLVAEDRISSVTGPGANIIPRDPEKNTVTLAAQAVFKALGIAAGVDVRIERALPIAGGLGSSAASAVAGAKAALVLLGVDDDELLLRAALEAEEFVAGRHLDNIAPCVYGGLVLVQDTEALSLVELPTPSNWWLTLLSPQQLMPTKESRNALPKQVSWALMVKQMTSALAVVRAFETGDRELLVRSFNDYFAEPCRGPLISGFMQIKRAALDNGAMACSISGGGPTVFAISENEQIAARAGAAMAKYSENCGLHVGKIGADGVKILEVEGVSKP